MPRRSNALGFSLIELVTVILILGILAFAVLPRLRVTDSSLLAGRDLIVTACAHAQQVAMARHSSSNPVTLTITGNSLDVRENGVSVPVPGDSGPVTLPSNVQITGGTGTLSYDKLGRTTPTAIVLNNGGATVNVEASGYAH